MEIINILADGFSGWCREDGVKDILSIVKNVLEILRIVVPIALIILTTLDVIKKVINPNEKEGQNKIMYRAIGALVVFLLPIFIQIVFKIVDIGKDDSGSYKSESILDSCWGNL